MLPKSNDLGSIFLRTGSSLEGNRRSSPDPGQPPTTGVGLQILKIVRKYFELNDRHIFKKLPKSCLPAAVRIDSGWNCTP